MSFHFISSCQHCASIHTGHSFTNNQIFEIRSTLVWTTFTFLFRLFLRRRCRRICSTIGTTWMAWSFRGDFCFWYFRFWFGWWSFLWLFSDSFRNRFFLWLCFVGFDLIFKKNIQKSSERFFSSNDKLTSSYDSSLSTSELDSILDILISHSLPAPRNLWKCSKNVSISLLIWLRKCYSSTVNL